MKVHIVCYEDVDAWILGKFALKMKENLIKLGIDAEISKQVDKSADINHHIIYGGYDGKPSSLDTFMITHIDDISKLNHLKKISQTSQMGICMSKETMDNLARLKIPRDKLSFVNPAHDNVIKPKKYVIGITCRVQNDGRKREKFIGKLAKDIDPKLFKFKIMGDGWDEYVEKLQNKGFEVEYFNKFIYEKYVDLIPTLDYYLYMGKDEGQMGFVDALAAGVKTIVVPQGYHLDAKNGITYGFDSYDDLLKIFNKISKERKDLFEAVKTWNWLDYTKKHIEIWKYLIRKSKNTNYELTKDIYYDGIYSVEQFSNKDTTDVEPELNKNMTTSALIKEYFRHKYFKVKSKLLKI